jgi:sugar lactone lactonase YvrE
VTGVRTLLSGRGVGESPRWHDGRLWFCDWSTHEVVAVDPGGAAEVVAQGPPHPFCIDFLPDGRLLVVSGQAGALLRQEPGGEMVTHADLSGFSEAYWNDIVVDGRGNVFLNEVGFNLMTGAEPRPGSVAVVRPDGSAERYAAGLGFPNGMAVTPDNSALIVAESYNHRLTAFDIGGDGSLAGQRVWADLGTGTPDGICIDSSGAVWYADVPGKCCVRVREGGEVLETASLDRGCFACMLGGQDGSTLFMVAAQWLGLANPFETDTGQVLTLQATTPHAGWP